MATTQLTGLNPIGSIQDSDLILVRSGVEDLKATINDLKANLNDDYLTITGNLSNVQNKQSTFDNIKQPATDSYVGAVELATATETVAGTDTTRAVTPAGVQAKLADVDIVAGNGLTGGGNLGSDVTLNMGTPSTITGTSTNSVTADSHTHAIDSATTSAKGVVQLAAGSDVQLGTDNTKAVTSYSLANGALKNTFIVNVGGSVGFVKPSLSAAIEYLQSVHKVLKGGQYYIEIKDNSLDNSFTFDGGDYSWLTIVTGSSSGKYYEFLNGCISPNMQLYGYCRKILVQNGSTLNILYGNFNLSDDVNSGTGIEVDKSSRLNVVGSTIGGSNSIWVKNSSDCNFNDCTINLTGDSNNAYTTIFVENSSRGTFNNTNITPFYALADGTGFVMAVNSSELCFVNTDIRRNTGAGYSVMALHASTVKAYDCNFRPAGFTSDDIDLYWGAGCIAQYSTVLGGKAKTAGALQAT